MKHLPALLLTCLLLCGCVSEASAAAANSTTEPASATGQTSQSPGLYDEGSDLENRYQGGLRTYPLELPNVYDMRAMGDGLLILSGNETTTLTLLTGDNLAVAATLHLDFYLSAGDPSLRVSSGEVSYYDPQNLQTVVLDASLKAVSHIAAPGDLVGSPILSADRNTLYYCTSTAIRAWDLETGIRRCVKEIAYPEQSITGLHYNDTVLQCRILDNGQERTLLLAVDTGLTCYERSGEMTLCTKDSRYYASFPTGMTYALLFGEGEDDPQALTPADLTASCVFLEEQNAAVTIGTPSANELQLDYYDLETGLRRSTLTLVTDHQLLAVEDIPGSCIYLLIHNEDYGCETIYRWDVGTGSSLLVHDATDYTGTYYTAAAPDRAGITKCQTYAAEIGRKYGIEVLVWEDAAAVEPWDYDFEVEYLVPVIQRELELLDQRLAQYPDVILTDTASHFTALKICLVRQLTGTAESGSLDTATGLQFLDGTDAYVVIAAGEFSERTLYHELFHAMETHILNESIAFDQWEALNPSGFAYDYDYRANAQRDSGIYLQNETRSFVDTYSMSFPKEDRARIMEYAMLSGNQALFKSDTMQAKLLKLCEGIREAYGLKKSEETFLWEQYLSKPLA
ncbi:MAG: hypothetical protein Q4D50_08110 [Eubacteriales bacterium]|nr:hypothetical protein [Eubacteriales bacterium]